MVADGRNACYYSVIDCLQGTAMKNATVFCAGLLPAVLLLGASAAAAKPLKLQFFEPAENSRAGWECRALPLGNGSMGAMMFGGTDSERIQLNEETLWTNGPGGNSEEVVARRDPQSDVFGNVDAWQSGAMQAYTERCFDDYYAGTYTLAPAREGPEKILPNHRLGLGTFTSFADLYLTLNHRDITGYRRELDLRTGISRTTHTAAGITYTREAFMSHPDKVLVYRITADRPAAVSLTISPRVAHNGVGPVLTERDDRGNDGRRGRVTADIPWKLLRMDGVLNNGMTFAGNFMVLPQGGILSGNTLPDRTASLTVTGADSVMVVVALATDYENAWPRYRSTDPAYARRTVNDRTAAVRNVPFETLRARHLADYTRLFGRVELDLGGTYAPDESTASLLASRRAGGTNRYLDELVYQYGRYLLMSSSREDTLPANLQGVWADQLRPAWQGDYHTNINLQMNYWPAYAANLAETGRALTEYVDSLQAPGAVTAKKLYGVDGTWMVNCSANALGFTGNINSDASLASTASAFILQNVFDEWEYTRDTDRLRTQIYPMMKRACQLFLERLQPGRTDADRKALLWAPSWSSEHGPWTVGAAFDQQLIYLLFADTVTAAGVLKTDADFVKRLKDAMARLYPVDIGSDGQIKEYRTEGNYLCDRITGERIPKTDPNHRHNSQMMVLLPGDIVTSETPSLQAAAKTTLNLRGDGASGWSMGQKFGMWARLRDGNRAYGRLYANWIRRGVNANLFDRCPPFQIDGNFGICAGLGELLLQSYAGYADILPALPDAWSDGSVQGLVAEGNFVFDIAWKAKRLTALAVTARSGGLLKVKASAVASVFDATAGCLVSQVKACTDGSMAFETERGHCYRFAFGTADFTQLRTQLNVARAAHVPVDATGYTTARRIAEQGHCWIPGLSAVIRSLQLEISAAAAR